MTSHEMFAAMPTKLAQELFDYTFAEDKLLYRAALQAVAQTRKMRPVFLERQPRAEREQTMLNGLKRPGLELTADGLIRNFLLKKYNSVVTDFLDALKISHDKGVVEDLPKLVEPAALNTAVDQLLQKYPREAVWLYLHAFNHMNDYQWSPLDELLHSDPRLIF